MIIVQNLFTLKFSLSVLKYKTADRENDEIMQGSNVNKPQVK